jgi:uncharacterized protein (DUF1778 family)
MSRIGPPRPQRRATYAMRLRESERRLIETAAIQRGEVLSAYIRTVALEAARRDLGRFGVDLP